MNLTDTLRKLGILRYGSVHGVFKSYKEMPDELMYGNVYNKEKDLMTREDFTKVAHSIRGRGSKTALVVLVAIFVVIALVLVACSSGGTNSATASKSPGASSSGTPASSATSTSATVKNCQADASSDSIDAGKYFGGVLAQVKKDWKPDARISSVRFDAVGKKDFGSLCTLKTDSNWEIVFYSLSSKTELVADLDNSTKDGAGLPKILYRVIKTDNSTSTSLTLADMKQQGGWKFSEYSRPETAASEAKRPENPFVGWKMSMSQVVQKLIDRVQSETITGGGFYVTIAGMTAKAITPYVSMYWENGTKKTMFFVEPITLKTYDQQF